MLWADAKKLCEEGTEPGVIVVYVFTETSACAGESKERGEGGIGGDVSEGLFWKVEKKRSMLEMVDWDCV